MLYDGAPAGYVTENMEDHNKTTATMPGNISFHSCCPISLNGHSELLNAPLLVIINLINSQNLLYIRFSST